MWNQVVEYVREQRMLDKGDRVIVGVSGGADSVCLLFLLKELQHLYDLELHVVHINHGLRGEEAKRDEEYVVALCDELEVSCHVLNVDVDAYVREHKCSTEEAGRILRYEAFEREYNKLKCNKIAIAHNKNDVAETVLLNLARGTGIKGLTGIDPVRGAIIRPLLRVTREEIETYLEEKERSFCTDSTNLLDVYTRNKVRHHVLPALAGVNDQAVSHIARCASNLREIEAYLERQTVALYERIVTCKKGQYSICADALRLEDPVLAKRLIRKVIHACAGKLKDIEEKHVAAVYALQDKEVSKQVDLPYGMVAVRAYDAIIIKERQERAESLQEGDEMPIESPGTYMFGGGKWKLRIEIFDHEKNRIIPKNSYTKWFDYDKIKNTIFLRYRRQGDYLIINEKGNKKTIKSLFIDEKIPREQRGNIPLICDGNHVMWVIEGRSSVAYNVTEQTKKILVVTIMEV